MGYGSMGYGGTAVWEYGVWDMISRLVTMHSCAQYRVLVFII